MLYFEKQKFLKSKFHRVTVILYIFKVYTSQSRIDERYEMAVTYYLEKLFFYMLSTFL